MLVGSCRGLLLGPKDECDVELEIILRTNKDDATVEHED